TPIFIFYSFLLAWVLLTHSNSHCDTGYLLYGDFCYYFETKMVKNWQDAEAHCTREQGHLASFHTEEELSFLIVKYFINTLYQLSAKARATYMAPKLVFLTYFLILCKSVKTFITNLKNLRLSSILHNILRCQNLKILTVSPDLRIFSHGRHTSLTTGRIMKTVCTSQERLTMILENSMMTSAQPQGIISAKKV
uniref:C-type lectin domain-containing protein n=1 Tax=Haplochromis burtoni TaxID=8153 RepID=A0A3Q2V296_HAPBU